MIDEVILAHSVTNMRTTKTRLIWHNTVFDISQLKQLHKTQLR